MIRKKIENALNKQISAEAYSSNLYLYMASWAEQKGLNGTSQFLYKHADEERMHMLKLMHYVNERGGTAKVPAIKLPSAGFKTLKKMFELILEHEVKVSNEINKLVSLSLSSKDHTTNNFLQWYVAEQIEEEALFRTILDKLKLIGEDKGGLYLFDRDIASIVPPNSQVTI